MITDYATLIVAVASWTARTDLTARMGEFVSLAEARIGADMKSPALEQTQTVAISSSVATLPDNVIDILGLRIVGATDPEVEVTSRERLYELAQRGTGSKTYACMIGRTVELSTATGSLEIRAKCRVPALETGVNWLITTYPNVYLFATLLEAFDFLRNDAAVQKYQLRYQEAIAQADRALGYSGTQQFARPRWTP